MVRFPTINRAKLWYVDPMHIYRWTLRALPPLLRIRYPLAVQRTKLFPNERASNRPKPNGPRESEETIACGFIEACGHNAGTKRKQQDIVIEVYTLSAYTFIALRIICNGLSSSTDNDRCMSGVL